MIIFDKKTKERWESENINNIYCKTIQGGCEGKKVEITHLLSNEESINDYSFVLIEGFNVYIKNEDYALFKDSRLTWSENKWIFVSNEINTRCGCGKSFSIKSGNKIHDKIHKIKSAMKQKREDHH